MTVGSDRSSPRERLLAAANELFYEDGICTVGIDRILKHAGVARASLYSTFGSKDELVRAYLEERSESWQELVREALESRWDDPCDRIVGIFVLLTEWFAIPGFRGCPFINASAEAAAGDAVEAVRERHRAWLRGLFARLAADAGAGDPDTLAAQLVVLYDGSMVGAQLDRAPTPGNAAQAAARALVLSAVGHPSPAG